MKTLRFSKMHGLGNDFMVINAIKQTVDLHAEQIQKWADRQFGIGFDQLLLVESAQTDEADFRYRIFNADGGEVSQCGNGARCFVKFVIDQQLTDKTTIIVETASGMIYPTLQSDGMVSVDMGHPVFEPSAIPFTVTAQQNSYLLTTPSFGDININALSMGNPHAVLLVDDVDVAPVAEMGLEIQQHECFPEQVNVEFMQVQDRHNIRLRVYERGAGETLACGTGACAAVVSGIQQGLLSDSVKVTVLGGELIVSWSGNELDSVIMTGPAEHVFDGEIEWRN